MYTLKLSEISGFFGSSRGIDLVKEEIKKRKVKPDCVDFEGVSIIKGTHSNILEFLGEYNAKPINMSEKDVEFMKQAALFNNNFVDYKDIDERKKDTSQKFKEKDFVVLVNKTSFKKKEKASLAYIREYNKRGIVFSVYYQSKLRDFEEGMNLFSSSISRVEEVTWEDLHKGNFYLRKLNEHEVKFVNILTDLSSKKSF